jgi:ribonuclease HII
MSKPPTQRATAAVMTKTIKVSLTTAAAFGHSTLASSSLTDWKYEIIFSTGFYFTTSVILLAMQLPDFNFEKDLWQKGFQTVVGADEVGRGAFAGPVTAAGVVFSSETKTPQEITINDSKRLTQKQRERACVWVKENCLSWSIGQASVAEINRLGMGRATHLAFRRALKVLTSKHNKLFLLVDAFYVPYVSGLQKKFQKPIKGGDGLSFSIAAASIVAKVYRDNLMTQLARKHPHYLWQQNKGYGTKAHQEAIIKLGVCRHHRESFVNSFLSRVQ